MCVRERESERERERVCVCVREREGETRVPIPSEDVKHLVKALGTLRPPSLAASFLPRLSPGVLHHRALAGWVESVREGEERCGVPPVAAFHYLHRVLNLRTTT